jgi:hypothetical protein
VVLDAGRMVGDLQAGNLDVAGIGQVDDEPGDADFISIKEAVNSSNPGDTIEVYSGIYYEEGILGLRKIM